MKQAMDELGLSARAYDKVRRVAAPSQTSTAPSTSRSCTLRRRSSTGCWTGSSNGQRGILWVEVP
jgi:hypothetical protein